MEFPSSVVVDDLFQEIQDLLKEPESNWKYVGDEGSFRISRKKHKKNKIKMCKVTGTLKVPVQEVIKLYDDFPARRLWDPMCKVATLVQQSGAVQIHHLELAPMPLISERDVVYFTSSRVSPEGDYIGISQSLKNSNRFLPPKKDVVRMEIIISGTKLEPCTLEDGSEATKVTLFGITDPKGFIPNLNLKTIAMKSAALLCNMRDYLYKEQSKVNVQSG